MITGLMYLIYLVLLKPSFFLFLFNDIFNCWRDSVVVNSYRDILYGFALGFPGLWVMSGQYGSCSFDRLSLNLMSGLDFKGN